MSVRNVPKVIGSIPCKCWLVKNHLCDLRHTENCRRTFRGNAPQVRRAKAKTKDYGLYDSREFSPSPDPLARPPTA